MVKYYILTIYSVIDDIIEQLKQIESMDRVEFLEMFQDYLDFEPQFSKIRTILYMELGARPERGEQEREVIYNTLDKTLKFEEFTVKEMKSGDMFYLLNKAFYDKWLSYASSNSKKYLDHI